QRDDRFVALDLEVEVAGGAEALAGAGADLVDGRVDVPGAGALVVGGLPGFRDELRGLGAAGAGEEQREAEAERGTHEGPPCEGATGLGPAMIPTRARRHNSPWRAARHAGAARGPAPPTALDTTPPRARHAPPPASLPAPTPPRRPRRREAGARLRRPHGPPARHGRSRLGDREGRREGHRHVPRPVE